MKTAVLCPYFADGLVVPLVEGLGQSADQIHLWLLDFVGARGCAVDLRHGAAREVPGQLAPDARAGADVVLLIDDDVRPPGWPATSWWWYAPPDRAAQLAQPALTGRLHHSHAITLRARGAASPAGPTSSSRGR